MAGIPKCMPQTVGNRLVQCVGILGSFLANLQFRNNGPYKQNPLLETSEAMEQFLMKKIFYEKVGRRYVPVKEYDPELIDSFPKGAHLIICNPGCTSYRYNIDPDYASLIAASYAAKDVLANGLVRASEMRPSVTEPLTPEQSAAWDNMIRVFGERGRYIQFPSAHEIASNGLAALEEAVKRLYKHESVKNAFEHFKLVCKLVEENHG